MPWSVDAPRPRPIAGDGRHRHAGGGGFGGGGGGGGVVLAGTSGVRRRRPAALGAGAERETKTGPGPARPDTTHHLHGRLPSFFSFFSFSNNGFESNIEYESLVYVVEMKWCGSFFLEMASICVLKGGRKRLRPHCKTLFKK